MKKNIRTGALGVFIFSLLLCLSPSKLNADSKLPPASDSGKEPLISMDFQDASLKDILKIFSIQSGLNFISSEGVQDRKLTLYFDNVPLDKAMSKLFKANNLSYELDTDANIFIVKDLGKLEPETVTKVFYLKHATVSSSNMYQEIDNLLVNTPSSVSGASTTSASSSSSSNSSSSEEKEGITEAIKKLLSDKGTVMEDARTNSIIVTDSPSRIATIAQVIASLDVAMPQVMLEVEMLDVSKNVVDKMGINWGSAASYSMQILSASQGSFFPVAGNFLSGTPTAGTVSFPTTLKVILDFLRTQTDTRYLARPRILTLNNSIADIRITTQESVGVTTTTEASTSTTSATPERAQTGVSLRVTPQIDVDNGEVTMFIFPEVGEATAGNTFTSDGATFQYRDPETRSSKSVVRIKDGDTVIVGGLIRNEFLKTTTKIPILGDLPIVGALFRHVGGGTNSSDKNKQRELLIFITPRIVKDSPDIKLAQVQKPAFPEREQSGASATRDLAILNSLDNFDKKKR